MSGGTSDDTGGDSASAPPEPTPVLSVETAVFATSTVSLDPPNARPQSKTELFLTFNALALQGFGGVLAVAQRELVENKRWMTKTEFVEMLALGQVLPGPNVVNIALMFGDRFFGTRGALAALAGMLAVPLVIVLSLTAAYAEFSRVAMVSGALRGMGAVAAGLILSTAIKLMGTLRTNRLGPPMAALFASLTVVMIAWLRWPLIWVLAGLGSVAIALAWRRLR